MDLIRCRAPLLAQRIAPDAKTRPSGEAIASALCEVTQADEADLLLEDLHGIDVAARCDGTEEMLIAHGVPLNDVTIGDALAKTAISRRGDFDALMDRLQVLTATHGSIFTLFEARHKQQALVVKAQHQASFQVQCQRYFGELGQGTHCQVRVYQEADGVGFLIDHGGAQRTERVINEQERPEIRRLRRCLHDMVLFSASGGELRVLASSERERLFYARLFGEIVAGDAALFVPSEAYILDAIVEPGYAEVLSGLVDRDIERVTLRELKLISDDSVTSRHIVASKDVLRSIANDGPNLDGCFIAQARFSIVPRVRNGRRCFELTVYKGNRRKCNAPWSNDTTEELIRALRLRRDDVA